MADTFDDLDLFASLYNPATATPEPPPYAPGAAPLTEDLLRQAMEPRRNAPEKPVAARATYLRPHTRYHSEIRLPDDPSGIIRVVSNERLPEFGLTWHPASE